MKKTHKKQIEKILGAFQCPKDYVCYTSGMEKLCRAEDIGLESFLVCLDKDPTACPFSVHFGEMFFCQCPLRMYISRKVTK